MKVGKEQMMEERRKGVLVGNGEEEANDLPVGEFFLNLALLSVCTGSRYTHSGGRKAVGRLNVLKGGLVGF